MDTHFHRLFFFLALLVSVTAIPTAGQKPDGWDRYMSESNRPVRPFRIIGNVFYVGTNDSTSFLIVTSAGLILVDTAFEESVPMIHKNIETLGYQLTDVKIILSGHAHFDHVAGHQTMKELTGAMIYATAPDALILGSGGLKGFFPFAEYNYRPVTVDKIIKSGDRVKLGNVSMRSHMLPGHTEGNTAWSLTADDNGKKYTVLIAPSMSVNAGVKLVNNKEWAGVTDAYISSFKKLRTLKCDVFLSSHAGFFDFEGKIKKLAAGVRPNPFIDRTGFISYVDRMETAFKAELKRQRSIQK